MKKSLLIALLLSCAPALLGADAKNKITDASKQLAEKANYSWTSTSKEADGSSGRLGPIEGKAEKGGVTYLSFTVGGGVPVEVYMNGEKGTAKALEGWQTFDEIAATSGTAAAVVRFLRAYKAPAVDSAALAQKLTDVKEADGAIIGDLKEEAAKELLLQGARRREGQDPPKVADPKGSVKFWVKDNVLTKYEVNIRGKVTAGERESDINRTTTIEIKDAGSTKLEVPADAKAKLT